MLYQYFPISTKFLKSRYMALRVMTHFHTAIPFPQTKRCLLFTFSTVNVLTSYDTFRSLEPRPCYNTFTCSNHHHFVSHSEGADTQTDSIRRASSCGIYISGDASSTTTIRTASSLSTFNNII